MSKIDTSQRSAEAEIMDDFELKGNELEKTLTDLDKINKWLGGNKITLSGVKKIIAEFPERGNFHIADIGCGNGSILREIARWGRANGYKFQLTGIDANPFAIEICEKMSTEFEEISFKTLDIFSKEFQTFNCDILLCTLTLHHFKNKEIANLLSFFNNQIKLGIVINDLHRSKTAYRLFQAFCAVFINNEIARKDGLISILRGFKKEELIEFSNKLNNTTSQIHWKWAFRYQWIIQKKP